VKPYLCFPDYLVGWILHLVECSICLKQVMDTNPTIKHAHTQFCWRSPDCLIGWLGKPCWTMHLLGGYRDISIIWPRLMHMLALRFEWPLKVTLYNYYTFICAPKMITSVIIKVYRSWKRPQSSCLSHLIFGQLTCQNNWWVVWREINKLILWLLHVNLLQECSLQEKSD